MWKGWNKQPTISQPTHFTELDQDDRYYDERYLETIPEVDSISSRRQSAHIGLPELPFRAVPPMTEIPQSVNVYTQPFPTTPTDQHMKHGLRVNVDVQEQAPSDDISPSTPRTSQEQITTPDGEPVSPIEQIAPPKARAPLPERAFQSQIPRKVSRPREDAKQAQTKWDEYSGEPTNDERSKPASVRPGSQPVEMQYPHLKERTRQILAGLREREAAKKIPWGKPPPPVSNDPLDNPPQREPWKGASGRAAIVEPVRNNPAARLRPLQGPLQDPERVTSQSKAHPGPFDLEQIYEPQPQSQSSAQNLRSIVSEESIKPVVPLKSSKRNKSPDLPAPQRAQSPADSPEFPSSPPEPFSYTENPHQYREAQYARVESPQYDPEPTTPTTPTPDMPPGSDKISGSPESHIQPETEREQSHFSWTTYTTGVADSPRSMAQVDRESSVPPPIPELPQPILVKKRPVSTSPFMCSSPYMQPNHADSWSSVVRKPVPGFAPRTSSISSVTSRTMSTSKSLPPTPTMFEAHDKIENIDAQLEALDRRKHNVSRIIRNLEESLKKNAVVYDIWKRKEVEKNVANHRMEIDDINSEYHELSLKRHRAQRKRDLDENLEPSAMWIKRVTS